MTTGNIFIPSNVLPRPSAAEELVTSGFDTAQAYASQSYNNAILFLNQLAAAADTLATLPVVDTTLTPVNSAIHAYTSPPIPARPTGLELNVPSAPADPTLVAVSPLTVPDAPAFTATPADVDLNIAKPVPLTSTLPTAPSLDPVPIPDAPALSLPDVPTLIGITVPTAPLLDLPLFVAVAPDSPQAPAYFFSFTESTYTSELLTDLRERLAAWIAGPATGLEPAVEMAIWERGRAREVAASNRKIGEVVKGYARNGFTKPPGAMAIEMGDALQESQSTLIANSREVMIKQADLEQSNRKFAFEQAWKVEEGLIQYTSAIAARALEAAKFAQQVGIDIYRAAVEAYSADIRKYATDADVYKARLQGELAKLDVYKAEIEGQRLIGTINEQSVGIYRERVNAAKALIEMFTAQVQASNVRATINKTIIEAFAAEVGAFAETVRAKASEYDAYATQVKAEVSKLEVFTAQAQAYSAQVTGFKATVEALTAAKSSELEINQKVPLDVFKTRTEVFRTVVGAEASRAEAVSRVYTADAGMFGEQVRGETARVSGEVEVYKADISLAATEGNLRIEAAKANLQLLVQKSNQLIEAIKGGAQVAAQLAAAALSSVNLSAQLGDHTSFATSNSSAYSSSDARSTSNVTSDSTSNSTSEAHSVSESTSDQTSNSTINSTIHQYSN